jgi:hypothetical protein
VFNLIKQIFQKNKNAYVVVVENERPVFVIQSFDEYGRICDGNYRRIFDGNENVESGQGGDSDRKIDELPDDLFDFAGNSEEEIENLNREIMDLQSSPEFGGGAPGGDARETKGVRVEDIPVI